ncbi:DUF3159 domain-containing protein [Saxibacter everestensis]|uniref:DUF3159 domain-containing protein n=1 Tax=Saxibacter everestensis TaxID=2909229 RepID=A0ABY8QWE8_9MICO|nr:DUF3159 domain-containing protein [Brevibacteriaceae bacterium ZFBP1038]
MTESHERPDVGADSSDATRRDVDPEQPAATLGKALGRGALGRAGSGSVKEAIGGPWGVINSVLPGLLFVIVYSVTSELKPSLISAIGAGVGLMIVSLFRRQPVSQSIGGLIGVALCAFVAMRSGKAEDYFLIGLFTNAGSILIFLISILIRWPLIGLIAGYLTGEELRWRNDPARLRLFQRISWMWIAAFALRLIVQVPLYLSGNVAALGTLRLALGLPLFALVAWLSWLLIRKAPTAREEEPLRPAS